MGKLNVIVRRKAELRDWGVAKEIIDVKWGNLRFLIEMMDKVFIFFERKGSY